MARADDGVIGEVMWEGTGYRPGRPVEMRGRLAALLAGDPPEWVSKAAWVGLGRMALSLLNAGYGPDTEVIIEGRVGMTTGGVGLWLRVLDDSCHLDRERARVGLVPVAAGPADRGEVTP